MAEAAQAPTEETADFGRALGSLLRNYLETARTAVEGLPGGARGYQVMSIAAADACSNQAAVAEQLGIDRTVMTYLVDDLEKAGLAERRPDPADRRARQVVLTTKGKKAHGAPASRIADVERTVLGSLSDDEAETFRSLLSRVAAGGPVVDACAAPPEC